MEHGEVYSLAGMLLENLDRQALEIVEVLPNLSSNLEFVGLAAAILDHTGPAMLGGPGFPSYEAGALEYFALDGQVLLPHRFSGIPEDEEYVLDLMVGVRLLDGDVGAMNGVLVRYRLGEEDKMIYFPHALILQGPGFIFDDNDPNVEESIMRRLGVLD